MLCKGVGVGLTVNPEDGQVGVILSLHEEEEEDEARGFIILPVDRAVEIATGMMRQAAEGHSLIAEIMRTPMDDRAAAIHRIVERMHGPTN